mgnify:CR=1 FL=1
MTQHFDIPTRALELRSTLGDDDIVTMDVREVDVRTPGDGEVLVRVEAAPINPSDLGMMLAMSDPEGAVTAEGDRPGVALPVSPAAARTMTARVGHPMPVGNEGAGVVVAAGGDEGAQALLGRTVGFVSGHSYSQYQTLPVAACLVMPEGTTPEQAAAPFVNPLTALCMVEAMRIEGHRALVHTVGASNLGLMLNRICAADGIGLVNIVRRPEQIDLVKAEGGEHVVVSGTDRFRDDLLDALRATGATIAFDAIGGGGLAGEVLSAMETVVSEGADFSRYGSDVHKQVYIYGGLDRSPTVLRRDFGMSWGVSGWLLTPFLGRIGGDRTQELRERVAREITTTFASSYGHRLTLEQVVDPEQVKRYGKMATGDKALVTPHA